jgi:hypothetical protein
LYPEKKGLAIFLCRGCLERKLRNQSFRVWAPAVNSQSNLFHFLWRIPFSLEAVEGRKAMRAMEMPAAPFPPGRWFYTILCYLICIVWLEAQLFGLEPLLHRPYHVANTITRRRTTVHEIHQELGGLSRRAF